MMRTRTFTGLVLLLSLCGCKVGPNYKRPALDVPGQYRGIAPNLPQQPAGGPFGEMQWPAVYQDEALQALIKEALTNNYDIRIAASRIMQAQASLGVTRANQFPTLGGVGSIQNIAIYAAFHRRALGRYPRTANELYRRFLGAISSCDGSCTRRPSFNPVREECGPDNADLTGSDRLFHSSPIRFPAEVF